MRCSDLPDRLHRDEHRRAHQHERHDPGRDRLGLAVAIGMVFVGRPRRDDQPTPDDERARDVGERLHAVRDQRVRVADHTGGDLGQREHHVRGDARLRGAHRVSCTGLRARWSGHASKVADDA